MPTPCPCTAAQRPCREPDAMRAVPDDAGASVAWHSKQPSRLTWRRWLTDALVDDPRRRAEISCSPSPGALFGAHGTRGAEGRTSGPGSWPHLRHPTDRSPTPHFATTATSCRSAQRASAGTLGPATTTPCGQSPLTLPKCSLTVHFDRARVRIDRRTVKRRQARPRCSCIGIGMRAVRRGDPSVRRRSARAARHDNGGDLHGSPLAHLRAFAES